MPGRSRTPARDRVELMRVLDLLSHDLGNTAHVVLGKLEMMDLGNGRGVASIEEIGRDIGSMHRMVDNVRVAIRAANLPYRPETVDLFKVIAGAREKIIRSYGSAPEVDISASGPDLKVRADDMLQDALAELMLISMGSCKVVPCRVSIGYEVSEGMVRILYEDGSENVDLSMIERSMKRLRRLLDDGDFQGSGTGLPMVKAIIDRYRGTIRAYHRVEGDPRSGLRFEIVLPK